MAGHWVAACVQLHATLCEVLNLRDDLCGDDASQDEGLCWLGPPNAGRE